jgi:hypothetical protein
MQADSPVSFAYVPCGHAVHAWFWVVDPSIPVPEVPIGQIEQSATEVPPYDDLHVAGGHATQLDALVLPLFGLYVPGGHGVHDEAEGAPSSCW